MPKGRCPTCGGEDVELIKGLDSLLCAYCALGEPQGVGAKLLKATNRKLNEIERDLLAVCPEIEREDPARRHPESVLRVLARRLHTKLVWRPLLRAGMRC
jgi:hypothetical protein